jgi:hypothetical protein
MIEENGQKKSCIHGGTLRPIYGLCQRCITRPTFDSRGGVEYHLVDFNASCDTCDDDQFVPDFGNRLGERLAPLDLDALSYCSGTAPLCVLDSAWLLLVPVFASVLAKSLVSPLEFTALHCPEANRSWNPPRPGLQRIRLRPSRSPPCSMPVFAEFRSRLPEPSYSSPDFVSAHVASSLSPRISQAKTPVSLMLGFHNLEFRLRHSCSIGFLALLPRPWLSNLVVSKMTHPLWRRA